MMERIIDRLDEYLKINKLTDNRVTKKSGLSVGTIGRAREEGHDLTERSAKKILDAYPGINADWLLFGEGTMEITPSDVYDRLKQVMEKENILPEELETRIGTMRGTFKRAMIRDDINLAKKWVDYFCESFPMYSFDWLMYGIKRQEDTDNSGGIEEKIKNLEMQVADLQQERKQFLQIIANLSQK